MAQPYINVIKIICNAKTGDIEIQSTGFTNIQLQKIFSTLAAQFQASLDQAAKEIEEIEKNGKET